VHVAFAIRDRHWSLLFPVALLIAGVWINARNGLEARRRAGEVS
jgi:hypothetical protein